MDRRLAGVVVLLLAALATVALPRILQPGIAGMAVAAPLPEPPPIGTCLIVTSQVRSILPCTEPHDIEVTARWLAGDPAAPGRGDTETCARAGAAYTGMGTTSTAALTEAVVVVQTALIRAPRADRVGRRGWSACTIRPWTYERYVGSIHERAHGSDRPAAYGSCVFSGIPATCTRPHDTEILGLASGFIPDIPGAAESPVPTVPAAVVSELSAHCRALAERLVRAADPTYGDQLSVLLKPDAHRGTGSVVAGTSRTGDQGIYYYGSCQVQARDDRLLIGSVVGLGDAPVPFA